MPVQHFMHPNQAQNTVPRLFIPSNAPQAQQQPLVIQGQQPHQPYLIGYPAQQPHQQL